MSDVSPLKRLVRAALPPVLLSVARALRHPRVFRGDFASWPEAVAASAGYADPAILERVVASARAVRDGHAAFERDGITFNKPEAHWPLLTPLLAIAARRKGRLTVVDFGGGMGSSYFQHRAWFDGVALDWRVVEQPDFVAAGQREFTAGPLRFFPSLDAAVAAGAADVVVFSSVLPYLPAPRAFLREVAARRFPFVLIDRTGVVQGSADRLTVQHVPPSLYRASYPAWFFARASLLEAVAPGYRLLAEWANDDQCDIAAEFRGFWFEHVA